MSITPRQEFMASFEARGSEMFKWIRFGETPDGDYYIAVDLAGLKTLTKNVPKTPVGRNSYSGC